ncbi:MAG: ribosome biogenesis GTPase YlqF [Defluviitaleaceae bacterium]|nr:ribosome biogenesis GTPase YlqF [Defluviitaleaceae bacterium]
MLIQWYPGHMAKAKRLILENISLVDVVIELLDARIPLSSKNPDIDSLAGNKHRILALNKSDLADPKITVMWKEYFTEKGLSVILVNSSKGSGVKEVIAKSRELMQEKIENNKGRGRIFTPIRVVVVGIPNVGKSTFINKLAGGSPAKTGDRPGVTKGKQWIKALKDFDILDTPGILWPKFDDVQTGLNLAFTGAVKDDIMDMYSLSVELIKTLCEISPEKLIERYKIELNPGDDPEEILHRIGKARGFVKKGSEIDLNRTAEILLDEFRGIKLGCISLERPPSE